MSDTRLMTPAELWAWAQANLEGLIVPAALLTLLLLGWMIQRAWRGGNIPNWIAGLGAFMATGWNAEATFEVLIKRVGVPAPIAAVGFFVFELLMLGAAIRAHQHFKRQADNPDIERPSLGPSRWFVFSIAFLTASAAAFNSSSVSVIIFRYAIALGVTWFWLLGYVPDEVKGALRKTTWALSPRRIGVRLGLIDPTDGDIATIHRERQTRLMVSMVRNGLYGFKWFRRWRTRRYQKLAEVADDTMLVDVIARVIRTEMAVELANPSTSEARLRELADRARARLDAVQSIAAPQRPAALTAAAELGPAVRAAALVPVASLGLHDRLEGQLPHDVTLGVNGTATQVPGEADELVLADELVFDGEAAGDDGPGAEDEGALDGERKVAAATASAELQHLLDSVNGDAARHLGGQDVVARPNGHQSADDQLADTPLGDMHGWDDVNDDALTRGTRQPAQPVSHANGGSSTLSDLVSGMSGAATARKPQPVPEQRGQAPDLSLRQKVFTWLDDNVPQGDDRDNPTLAALICTTLGITTQPGRGNVAREVRAWRKLIADGQREQRPGARLRAVRQPDGGRA